MDANTTEIVDDHCKKDTRGRHITDPRRRAEIIAGYASSGLSQKSYARREGVNYHTLVAWLGQSRRSAPPPPLSPPEKAGAPRFAQLAWPAAAGTANTSVVSSRLEVVLPDGVVLRGDDPAALLVLLSALAPRRPC